MTDRCRFISSIIQGMSVLDIGCVEHRSSNRERGHWLHDSLKASAAHILGMDYEVAEVEKLKAAGYNVVAADATHFDLQQEFEAIVAGELIEHLSNPGLFLDCAYRHLQDNGLLVLTTPNANCLIYFLENLFLGREIDNPDHACIFSPATITQLLGKHGFHVERIVFLAENTSYCHTSLTAKALVQLKQCLQLALGFLRPSVCHHMTVVARKKTGMRT